MRLRSVASHVGLAFVSLFSSEPMAAQSAAPPRLAGRWVLNLELSDKMEDHLREAFLVGAYSARARASGSGSKTDQPDDRELVGTLAPILHLVVTQDDSSVSMTDAAGFQVRYRTDGRKTSEYLLSGETVEITAKWKDRKLIIERKQARVGSALQTFFLDPASGRLVVQLRLKAATLPRTFDFRRVYDPATGS